MLHEEFKDFLLNLDADGDGGHLIRELGIQRSNLSEFLARFCAPRAGLFNQKLSVHFLESVAALGSTIWRKNVQKDYVAIATSCEEAPVVVFNDGRDARRCRCSELVDPEDVQVTIAMPPPQGVLQSSSGVARCGKAMPNEVSKCFWMFSYVFGTFLLLHFEARKASYVS